MAAWPLHKYRVGLRSEGVGATPDSTLGSYTLTGENDSTPIEMLDIIALIGIAVFVAAALLYTHFCEGVISRQEAEDAR